MERKVRPRGERDSGFSSALRGLSEVLGAASDHSVLPENAAFSDFPGSAPVFSGSTEEQPQRNEWKKRQHITTEKEVTLRDAWGVQVVKRQVMIYLS